MNWDDLNWERSYDSMGAYSQSKIAYGLFGLELVRRSTQAGWGITADLSHPGVAPTNLLAARPEIGRDEAVASRRLISALSRLGVMGTADSAGLPALMAATSPGDAGGRFYGPSGIRGLGGRPAEQKLYPRLRSLEDARRMWDVTQELIGVPFPAN